MRKITRLLISMPVLFGMIGAIFLAGWQQLSFGQADDAVTYQLRVYCTPQDAAVVFTTTGSGGMGTSEKCAGHCRDGIVPLDVALAKFPGYVSAALRTQVNEYREGALLTCLGNDKKALPPKCAEREEKDGDLPWFDPSSPGCQDLQDTELITSFAAGKCTFTLRGCGRLLLKDTTIGAPNSASCTREYRNKIYGGVAPLPQKVCCDIFQEAARAGSGCNPEMDADCDGEPNERDGFLHLQDPYYAPDPNFPDKNFNPADFDPRPPGLDWEEVMPNEPCKRCKWVATSGKLTCSPDGVKEHEYKATWECPTSGVKKTVTKRVAAKFPCTPPKRSMPPTPTSRPTSLQIFGLELLTNPSMALVPGFWTKPCVESQLESNLTALFKIEED